MSSGLHTTNKIIKTETKYYLLLVLLCSLFVVQLNAQQSNGKIIGKIFDESNAELPGVVITVVDNNSLGAVSDGDGKFEMTLPTGKYSLKFNSIGFSPKIITDIQVNLSQQSNINVVLSEAKHNKLQEVVITSSYNKASAEGLLNMQKNSSAVSDGISAEQMKKTPDNNVAQVLKRINGLSIQDNKFVVIRGMSDRYNNIMLNNSSLPSTEPNRRNFSFDLIPSGLIDNVIINKTATPDLPGEFAGGVVQIQTKDIPEQKNVYFSTGFGVNTQSLNNNIVSLKRGDNEVFGIVSKNRTWWKDSWDDNAYRTNILSQDFSKITDYDKKIPNNWGLYQYKYNPTQQYQLTYANVYKLEKYSKIGVIFSGSVRHDEAEYDKSIFRISHYDLTGKKYDQNTNKSFILNLTYQNPNHKISFKNLLNDKFYHTTQVLSGVLQGQTSNLNSYTDAITKSTLLQNKIDGEHVFNSRKIKLGWSVDRSSLLRNEPDMRNANEEKGNYGLSESSGSFSFGGGGGLSLMNAQLKETRYNASIYLQKTFTISNVENKLKFGFQTMNRNTKFTFQGMKLMFTPQTQLSDDLYNRPDYFIGSEQYLSQHGLYYKYVGPSFQTKPDGYNGIQNLHAAYIMHDVKLFKSFRIIYGLRFESNNMNVSTYVFDKDTFNNPTIVYKAKDYNSFDFFPSINTVYSINAKSNLRFAYSKTIARPDFRERSAFSYFDFYDYVVVEGITGLKDTKVDNIDLRYELYPNPGEVLSFSAFYKKFLNPVELLQIVASDAAINYFFNLDYSKNYGFEAEYRKQLAFINKNSTVLKNMYFGANLSYMISTVKYDIESLISISSGLNPNDLRKSEVRSRPPQGLSPYIINSSLGYDGSIAGFQVSYNRIGPRLMIGGPESFDDQYENPRDLIDAQLYYRFKNVDIKLNVSDLLNQPYIIYQNAGVTSDKTQIISDNQDPKGNNYNSSKDVVRSKIVRGTNIGISINVKL